MANVIFGETNFTVRFRIQVKEKQKVHFTNANMSAILDQMDASIKSLKILKFTCE